MLLLSALAAPLALLSLMLFMERVERPFRQQAVGEQLEAFLESARPDEVEAFVRDGAQSALERYWRRRRLARLLPARMGSRSGV